MYSYFSLPAPIVTFKHGLQKGVRALGKGVVIGKKTLQLAWVIGEGFQLIYRHQLYKDPNHPDHVRYVQHVCRGLSKVFNVQVEVHGKMPHQTALWVSNHISWLDVAVLGAGARVFFLAKAEVKSWPIIGPLAQGGGTLFIRRGSGDSQKIREQITAFLRQDIPVLFFPEATTSDGRQVKKIHGKLLQAAIDSHRPVQICIICYVNRHGKIDTIVPYIGEQTIAESLLNIIQMAKVTAHLMALPPIDSQGHTVESLTELVSERMQAGLAQLHQLVLKKS